MGYPIVINDRESPKCCATTFSHYFKHKKTRSKRLEQVLTQEKLSSKKLDFRSRSAVQTASFPF